MNDRGDGEADDDELPDDDLGGAWRAGDMDDSLPEDLFPTPIDARFSTYAGLPLLGTGEDSTCTRTWIVEGMLARGETSLLIGPPFGGKSVLAVHLAYHIGSGRPWFGRSIQSGPVLIIAGERALEMVRRLDALAAEDAGTVPVMVANGARLDLRRPDAVRLMRATIGEFRRQHGPPVAVIFDTLASLTPGADEIASRDMTTAMSTIAAIRDETQSHAMVLHHSPRDNPRASRGHSSVDGAVDLIWSIDRPAGKHRWRVLSANALAEPLPSGEFTIGSHIPNTGGSVAILRPATATLSDRDAAVLAALKASGGKPIVVSELTRTMAHPSFPSEGDGRRKAVNRSLEVLVDAGLALVDGEGKGRSARSVGSSHADN